MRYQVKVCGITNLEDALLCVDAGAHYLGFIFVPSSPRSVCVEIAASIADRLQHASCKLVGVFQNNDVEHIQSVRNQVRLDFVQLHGQESPQVCKQVSPSIKALHSVEECLQYASFAELILLDRPKGASDPHFATNIASHADINQVPPFLVAGGLTPANLTATIEQFKNVRSLLGFDVASGVESEPGRKDPDKLRQFMHIAHAGDRYARIR